ncbi:MAG: Zn-dependent exopeptidase M28, partial [Methanoculleus thermophilus]|nr:Zn-dependent exopeptidase M28 [Methanoculleus thermophilus]
MPSRSCLQVAFLAAYGIVFILAPAAAAPSDAPGYDPGIAALLDEVDGSEIRKTAYDLQNFSTRAYGSDGNR